MMIRTVWLLAAALAFGGCLTTGGGGFGDDDDDIIGGDADADADGDVDCTEPQANCDGVCVELDTDVSNCGACGNACAEGNVCADGTCIDPFECPEYPVGGPAGVGYDQGQVVQNFSLPGGGLDLEGDTWLVEDFWCMGNEPELPATVLLLYVHSMT